MVDFAALNWLAIFLATLASFVLGYLWYGPVFGNAWLAAQGKTADDIKPSATPFIITFFTTLATCIAMAVILQMLSVTNLAGGALLGLVVGLAFITCSNISDGAYCGWSWKLVAIQSGYRTVYCVLMGMILAVW
ncbi:MAG: DUF1761 domain-containing protein [Gammaproteobacteria bacterium]|nr:DUF1761 domain-containing protein [Gammaproteobacteria bacterium]